MVPSVDDPGQPKMMPCLPMAEYFVTGPRSTQGNNQRIIKNITLATNPLRISYYGKEIIISRYNYFKRMKKNHLAKVQVAQERLQGPSDGVNIGGLTSASTDETYKLARTIVH